MQRTHYPTKFRDWLLRPSVRVKIMGIVLGLVLLLGLGITGQVRASTTATLTEQLDQRGISTDLILINNTYALYGLLKDTLANNADLRYAFILNPSGRVLVHSFDHGFLRGLAEENSVAPTDRAQTVVLESDEGLIHDIAVPIFDGRAGVARVGLTEQSVRAAVDNVTRTMLLTTLAVSLLGLGAAYLLTLILTRPILTLVDATQAVARGDLSRKTLPWSDDEIGQLSTAFNRMTNELADAQRAMLCRHRELTALNAVANAVNTPASLTDTLDRSLRALLDSLSLPAGWIFLLDRAGERVQPTSWIGLSQEIGAREVETGLRGCPCTAALTDRQAVVVSPLPERCPLREAQTIAAHVTVPILSHARVLGVLGVASGGRAGVQRG